MQRRSAAEPKKVAGPAVLSRWQAAAVFAITAGVTLAPFWFVAHPPLHDYPFHLARVDILARWQASPDLQRWYEIRSFLLPNVGMDVIVLLLSRVVPIAVAGRLFVAFVLASTLGGTVALHRVLFGRFTLWPFVSACFLFNWILLYGFLNYLLGVAVLLWATAAWITLADSGVAKRVLVGTFFSVALFFCHFVALVLYAMVVAGYELQRSLAAASARAAARELLVGAAIFVVPLALFLACPTSGEAGSTVAYQHPFLVWKLSSAWRSLMFADRVLDAVLATALVLGIVAVWRAGTLQLARPMTLALVVLALAFFAVPERLFSARHIDERLPVAIVFLGIASVCPTLNTKRLRAMATAALVLLVIFRSAWLVSTWRTGAGILTRFTQAFARLPDEAVVFVASEAPMPTMQDRDLSLWQPPLKHVVSLAGLQRAIFVPATWAHPSQQPITITPRYRAMYEFQAQNPIEVRDGKVLGFLVGRLRRMAATAADAHAPIYLLLLYPERLHLGVPEHAHVFAADPMFVLLAIDPPATE